MSTYKFIAGQSSHRRNITLKNRTLAAACLLSVEPRRVRTPSTTMITNSPAVVTHSCCAASDIVMPPARLFQLTPPALFKAAVVIFELQVV